MSDNVRPFRGRDTPKAPKGPLPYVWFDNIEPCVDTMDFVQGLLVEGTAAVIYGESNSGKTFWTLDLALHVATGWPYYGRRVEQGSVAYCVLEGKGRFRNRVVAWRREHEAPGDIPFAVVEESLNLLDPDADTGRLIEMIHSAAKEIASPLKLVVIDTLSRALAGGRENTPEDMGLLVINMDRIRAETGACVLFIHHSGKDAAKGARGHSSLRAAIDTEIEVVDREGLHTATAEKQRDLKKGDVFNFELNVVEVGKNRYDEPVTTCVVAPTDREPPPKASKLSGQKGVGARLLRLAIDRYGKPLPRVPGYPTSEVLAVTDKQWRDTFYQGNPEKNGETNRKSYNRVKTDLVADGIVTSMDEFFWFSRKADEA